MMRIYQTLFIPYFSQDLGHGVEGEDGVCGSQRRHQRPADLPPWACLHLRIAGLHREGVEHGDL